MMRWLHVAFGAAGFAAGAPAMATAQRLSPAGVADTARLPLSPGRAFLYSLAVPGLAQARLGRPIVGAGFFLVEAVAIAVIHRTSDELRLARAFRRDSVPLRYSINEQTGVAQTDANGNPVVAAWLAPAYSDSLVRARRLQLEDWSAVLVFNHLVAGAEAFVASQLWDLPEHVKLRATNLPRGVGLGVWIQSR
ncbi:MAG: hypothetical protein IT356_00320 [Gemmatimonadaceae bacterium]|nr:hypothetical protein [Gemmatimonadaceae bacterium]